ncbi:MAG: helix-turn-helix domain-containing protein [Lachnospiraceae bacterium]|nr:helix-turn-helix domain-containing protein [Lachnospiraceae bacterium]
MENAEIIKRIEIRLKEIGMSKADFYEKSGVSSATYSQWNTGMFSPSKRKLQAAADALGVSVEYLTGEASEPSPAYYLNDETAEMAQKLFENHDLKVLFDAAQDASPEDLKTTYDMLMALKRKERGEV